MTIEFSIIYLIAFIAYGIYKLKTTPYISPEQKQLSNEYCKFIQNKQNINQGKLFIRSTMKIQNGKDCSYNRYVSPVYSNYNSISDIKMQGNSLRLCKPFNDLLKAIYEDTNNTLFTKSGNIDKNVQQRINQINNYLFKNLNNISVKMYINTPDVNNKSTFVTIEIKNKQITNIHKQYKQI